MIKRLLIAFVVVLGAACSSENPSFSSNRKFYMGFTPMPYDLTEEAISYTYSQIGTNSDIIDHHFDNGVPWPEAFANQSFHQSIQSDWALRKSRTPTSSKVYVSVSPINFLKTGLAAYRGEEPDEDLTGDWKTYAFNDWHVKQAYLNYCKRIIDYFQPTYFNMSIGCNLLHLNRPDLWSNYMDLHKFIYGELKKTYPTLVVFSSQAAIYFLDGFFTDANVDYERKAATEVLEYSDLFAISLYPYLTNLLGSDIPDGFFDKIFTLSQKPVAVAETGYPAQSFSIELTSGITAEIDSTPDKQDKFIKNLLTACEKYKVVFVINYAVRDYDQLWVKEGSHHDLSIAWKDCGLIDENGIERPSLFTWREWLKKNYKP